MSEYANTHSPLNRWHGEIMKLAFSLPTSHCLQKVVCPYFPRTTPSWKSPAWHLQEGTRNLREKLFSEQSHHLQKWEAPITNSAKRSWHFSYLFLQNSHSPSFQSSILKTTTSTASRITSNSSLKPHFKDNRIAYWCRVTPGNSLSTNKLAT